MKEDFTTWTKIFFIKPYMTEDLTICLSCLFLLLGFIFDDILDPKQDNLVDLALPFSADLGLMPFVIKYYILKVRSSTFHE